MGTREVIEADLTWSDASRRFESSVQVAVEDGVVSAVGSLNEPVTQRLRKRAILPGFVNVHSHAFQRGLRGQGETFPQGAGSFWTWREAMYKLVDSLTPASAYELSKQCFEEMLSAGITTVGEFHYIHHSSSETEDFALDEAILRAAKDAGIRIALIQTFYKAGGFDKPLAGGQKRFSTQDLESYWRQFDQLQKQIEPSTQTLAVAGHSIRAVPLEDLKSLHAESMKRGKPFHMHVEEQPLEVTECVDRYGKPPMALVNEHLEVNPLFTAIHCTHTAAADMNDFIERGGNVCINPLTEGNLGDGIPVIPRILRNGGHITLGSDANTRLCWTEEMRWLEYVQRLSSIQRGVCVDERGSVACKLLEMATINGARCLGLKAGRIAPKCLADFSAIDLDTPTLRGWRPDTLLDSLVFGTGNEAIVDVCVAGKWRSLKETAR